MLRRLERSVKVRKWHFEIDRIVFGVGLYCVAIIEDRVLIDQAFVAVRCQRPGYSLLISPYPRESLSNVDHAQKQDMPTPTLACLGPERP